MAVLTLFVLGSQEGPLSYKTKAGVNYTFNTIAEELSTLGYESHMFGK